VSKLNQKLEKRIYKLMALAKGGVGGEKTNAQSALNKTLEKYDLDLSDFLAGEKTVEYCKNVRNKYDKSLLVQIIRKICGSKVDIFYCSRTRSISVDCLESQVFEISLAYDIYKPLLHDELKLTYDAFIQTNCLYASDNTVSKDDSTMTNEELNNLLHRMSTMKKTNINKCIDSK